MLYHFILLFITFFFFCLPHFVVNSRIGRTLESQCDPQFPIGTMSFSLTWSLSIEERPPPPPPFLFLTLFGRFYPSHIPILSNPFFFQLKNWRIAIYIYIQKIIIKFTHKLPLNSSFKSKFTFKEYLIWFSTLVLFLKMILSFSNISI